MNLFFVCVLLSIFTVTDVIFQESSSLPTTYTNKLKNLQFFENKTRRIQSFEIIEQFDWFISVRKASCSENWTQLTQSCYYLSTSHVSTIAQANKTCEYYFNQSNLMFVKDKTEFHYAITVLSKNHLANLLLQIDTNF